MRIITMKKGFYFVGKVKNLCLCLEKLTAQHTTVYQVMQKKS